MPQWTASVSVTYQSIECMYGMYEIGVTDGTCSFLNYRVRTSKTLRIENKKYNEFLEIGMVEWQMVTMRLDN